MLRQDKKDLLSWTLLDAHTTHLCQLCIVYRKLKALSKDAMTISNFATMIVNYDEDETTDRLHYTFLSFFFL